MKPLYCLASQSENQQASVCRSTCKTSSEQNLNLALHSQPETKVSLTTALTITRKKTEVIQRHTDNILHEFPPKSSFSENVGDFSRQSNLPLSCRKGKWCAPVILPPTLAFTLMHPHKKKNSISSHCIQSPMTFNVPHAPPTSTSERFMKTSVSSNAP